MADKPYSSKNLDDIRKRIDQLDHGIHDRLMERAELVLKIGEEKRKNNIQIVQPAREARMIRRLLDRHNGVLPEMAVVRIWRELVGAVSLLQTGLSVSVAPDSDGDLWELARDYFGSCLPFQKAGSVLSAIAAVREGRATFAVLPWPEDKEEDPWWELLGSTETAQPLRAIIRLPHGDDPHKINPDHKAIVISQTGFDESDDDCSFLLVRSPSPVSRARLIELSGQFGLEPISLSTKTTGDTHLMEVKGYITDENGRLEDFAAAIEDDATVRAVGGYPVPPVYSKTIEPKTD